MSIDSNNNLPLSPITQPPGTAPSAASSSSSSDNDNEEDKEEQDTPDEDEDEEDEEEQEAFQHIEIVGLGQSSNGRSCVQHVNCGDHVLVGDILRLHKVVVDCDGVTEEAISCVLIRDGAEACTVAYIPRALLNLPIVCCNVDKHIQIVHLYSTSDNSAKRRKSFLNCGVAGAIFLGEIPRTE
jgi:hypothetical protein